MQQQSEIICYKQTTEIMIMMIFCHYMMILFHYMIKLRNYVMILFHYMMTPSKYKNWAPSRVTLI